MQKTISHYKNNKEKYYRALGKIRAINEQTMNELKEIAPVTTLDPRVIKMMNKIISLSVEYGKNLGKLIVLNAPHDPIQDEEWKMTYASTLLDMIKSPDPDRFLWDYARLQALDEINKRKGLQTMIIVSTRPIQK